MLTQFPPNIHQRQGVQRRMYVCVCARTYTSKHSAPTAWDDKAQNRQEWGGLCKGSLVSLLQVSSEHTSSVTRTPPPHAPALVVHSSDTVGILPTTNIFAILLPLTILCESESFIQSCHTLGYHYQCLRQWMVRDVYCTCAHIRLHGVHSCPP